MSEENQNAENQLIDQVSTDAEKEKARAQGWADGDAWKGDPENFRTAKEFLQKGEEILPVLKERLDNVLDRVGGLQTALERKDEIIAKMMKFHEEDKQRAITSAITDLQARKRAAIEEADAAQVEAIDAEIDSHKKAAQELKEATDSATSTDNKKDNQQVTQAYLDWVPENKWYEEDPQMAADADELGAKYLQSGRFKNDTDVLKAVTRRIKQMYPDYFSQQTTTTGAKGDSVEGATHSAGTSRKGKAKHSYTDLPSDAKQACDRYVSQGIFKDRQEYLDLYEWE